MPPKAAAKPEDKKGGGAPPKKDEKLDKEAQEKRKATKLQGDCDRAVECSRLGLTDEVMQILEKNEDDLDALFTLQDVKYGRSILMSIAEDGWVDLLKQVIIFQAPVNIVSRRDKETPMILAARSDDVPVLEILVQAGAEVNAAGFHGNTALMKCCMHNALKAADYLLSIPECDVSLSNNNGENAFTMAVKFENFDVATLIMNKREVGVNTVGLGGNTVGHRGCFDNRKAVVQYFMDKGGDVELRNDNGENCMYIATKHGYFDLSNMLLSTGSSIDSRDQGGKTILMVSVLAGKFSSVQYCIQKGADVNAEDIFGCSPLMLAVQSQARSHLAIINELIAHGALVNACNKALNTPLHLACQKHLIPIAELLMDKGAITDFRNCDNRLAFEYMTVPDERTDIENYAASCDAKPCTHPRMLEGCPEWLQKVFDHKTFKREPVARLKNQMYYPDHLKPGTDMKEEEVAEQSREEKDAISAAIEREKERLRLEEEAKNPKVVADKPKPTLLGKPKKKKIESEDKESEDKERDKSPKKGKGKK